jgi:23S rRNA pseudouridine1911/1915/1917 synthase
LIQDEQKRGLEKNLQYEEWQTITLPEGLRLDLALSEKIAKSRNFIQNLIEEGQVLVNGEVKKASYKIAADDRVEICIPQPRELDVQPENIKLDVVYEDEDVIVVNKPQGMTVHPAPGSWHGTLVNALLHHCRDNLSGINGIIRPGIVHRIDKGTSGLLVVAKNDDAHNDLARQIKEYSARRTYRAIVHGVLSEPSGTVDAPIGRDPKDRKKMAVVFKNSKNATTHYYVLERLPGFTEIKAVLETGRTHQIRVHMAYIKHPVLGDPVYGPKKCPYDLPGQVLHAETLVFTHPRTGEKMEFRCEPPKTYYDVLEKIKSLPAK